VTYFYTEAEVCALLRVDPRTMRNWRKAGTGPPYMRIGNLWLRYEKEALNVWIAERTVSA